MLQLASISSLLKVFILKKTYLELDVFLIVQF